MRIKGGHLKVGVHVNNYVDYVAGCFDECPRFLNQNKMKDTFQVIITDTDGDIGIQLIDHLTGTKLTILPSEIKDVSGLSTAGLSKLILSKYKDVYRGVINKTIKL